MIQLLMRKHIKKLNRLRYAKQFHDKQVNLKHKVKKD